MSNKEMKEYKKLKSIVIGYYASTSDRKPKRWEVKTYIRLHNKFISLN